jgi:hypothetical protein
MGAQFFILFSVTDWAVTLTKVLIFHLNELVGAAVTL